MTLKHDIRPIIIHVLIPWNKVTLYCQIVPMCEGLIVVMVHCATYPGSAFRQIASSDIYDDQCTTCYGHKDRIILCSYRERSVHGVGMSTFSIIGYLSLLSGTQRAMDLLVPLQIFPPFSSLKQCKCQKYK